MGEKELPPRLSTEMLPLASRSQQSVPLPHRPRKGVLSPPSPPSRRGVFFPGSSEKPHDIDCNPQRPPDYHAEPLSTPRHRARRNCSTVAFGNSTLAAARRQAGLEQV